MRRLRKRAHVESQNTFCFLDPSFLLVSIEMAVRKTMEWCKGNLPFMRVSRNEKDGTKASFLGWTRPRDMRRVLHSVTVENCGKV